MFACGCFLFGLMQLLPIALSVSATHSKFICSEGECVCAVSGRVVVPESCDPSVIHSQIIFLKMGTDHYKFDPLSFGSYGEAPNFSGYVESLPGEMSVFGPTASTTPVPRITEVAVVELREFDLDGEGARRFNSWLRSVKQFVTRLTVLNGRLTRLTSDLLTGFKNLEALIILSAGLKVIESGAFRTLSKDAPALNELTIQFNKLYVFDWAVLLPIASSLKQLDMSNTSLSVMNATASFSMPKLRTVKLQNNNLTRISASVVEIWRNAKSASVDITRNPLCSKEDCSCCSLLPLKSLVGFDQSRQRTFLRAAFDCGEFHYKYGYSEVCTFDECCPVSNSLPLANYTSGSICTDKENAEMMLNSARKTLDRKDSHPKPKGK